MPRVSMLLHKSVAHDTRVRREAAALAAAGYEVTVVHLPGGAERGGGEALPCALLPATVRRGRERLPHPVRLGIEATRLGRLAAAARPDVVHAHDAAMLLPGLLAARRRGARLVYDSHELATGVPYRGGAWPAVVAAAERLGVSRADAVLTVSDGIAVRLAERYRLRAPPAVVRNACDLPPPGAAPAPDLRHELGIGGAPLVLHQGSAAPGRGCETLIAALALLPGAHLLLLGPAAGDAARLGAVATTAGVSDRVHFRPPAPPAALLSHTAQADVGVSLLDDSCENHRLALPNKLFEYIAAGLPVVVSELPEMARLVRARRIGWCADPADPESVAAALRAPLAQRGDQGLREHLAKAASGLTWAREKKRLLTVYAALEGSSGEAAPSGPRARAPR